MTIDRDHPIVREAEKILGQYSTDARAAITEGLYGARDAQLAAALLAAIWSPRELEIKIEELTEQLEEAKSDLKSTERENDEAEAELRRLLGDALEVIENNCSGFVDFVHDLRAEADL